MVWEVDRVGSPIPLLPPVGVPLEVVSGEELPMAVTDELELTLAVPLEKGLPVIFTGLLDTQAVEVGERV